MTDTTELDQSWSEVSGVNYTVRYLYDIFKYPMTINELTRVTSCREAALPADKWLPGGSGSVSGDLGKEGGVAVGLMAPNERLEEEPEIHNKNYYINIQN